jgi:hypothetical protein
LSFTLHGKTWNNMREVSIVPQKEKVSVQREGAVLRIEVSAKDIDPVDTILYPPAHHPLYFNPRLAPTSVQGHLRVNAISTALSFALSFALTWIRNSVSIRHHMGGVRGALHISLPVLPGQVLSRPFESSPSERVQYFPLC